MKPTAPAVVTVLLISCLAAASNPVLAICASPRLVASSETYVVTSGCEAFDCGSEGNAVTDNILGAFWALGDGDPAPEVGIDNGTYSARGNWLRPYSGYGAYISTTWAASSGIDFCIDFASDPRRCMAILLTDEHPDSGDGVFALATRAPDNLGNYYFDTEGSFTLSTMGRTNVIWATIDEANSIVEVVIDGITESDLDAALYLDPACTGPGGGSVADVIQGYEAFVMVLPINSVPPDNSDVNAWQKATGVVPLGQGMNFLVNCARDEALWVRAGLVFDSEFRTPFLSEQSTRLECTNTLAEPEDLIPRKPRSRQLPRRKPRSRHN